MVPLFDQPTAATTPPPPRRVSRRCLTVSRTSSVAPRYALKRRGDVTGEPPHARMLTTATCQPRSAAVAAIERTYVSCEPPPSPEASSSSGRFCSSGGGASTKSVSVREVSSAAPATAPPLSSEPSAPTCGSRARARRMPHSRSTASVPPSGVGTRRRWYLTARVRRAFAARMVCTWPFESARGCLYHAGHEASSGTLLSTFCTSSLDESACTPSSRLPSARRQPGPRAPRPTGPRRVGHLSAVAATAGPTTIGDAGVDFLQAQRRIRILFFR